MQHVGCASFTNGLTFQYLTRSTSAANLCCPTLSILFSMLLILCLGRMTADRHSLNGTFFQADADSSTKLFPIWANHFVQPDWHGYDKRFHRMNVHRIKLTDSGPVWLVYLSAFQEGHACLSQQQALQNRGNRQRGKQLADSRRKMAPVNSMNSLFTKLLWFLDWYLSRLFWTAAIIQSYQVPCIYYVFQIDSKSSVKLRHYTRKWTGSAHPFHLCCTF